MDEIVDPLVARREECSKKDKCQALKIRLDKCAARASKPNSEESCFEEAIDLVHCVDHCAMHGLFSKLK